MSLKVISGRVVDHRTNISCQKRGITNNQFLPGTGFLGSAQKGFDVPALALELETKLMTDEPGSPSDQTALHQEPSRQTVRFT